MRKAKTVTEKLRLTVRTTLGSKGNRTRDAAVVTVRLRVVTTAIRNLAGAVKALRTQMSIRSLSLIT